jgi:hypothetical protein
MHTSIKMSNNMLCVICYSRSFIYLFIIVRTTCISFYSQTLRIDKTYKSIYTIHFSAAELCHFVLQNNLYIHAYIIYNIIFIYITVHRIFISKTIDLSIRQSFKRKKDKKLMHF